MCCELDAHFAALLPAQVQARRQDLTCLRLHPGEVGSMEGRVHRSEVLETPAATDRESRFLPHPPAMHPARLEHLPFVFSFLCILLSSESVPAPTYSLSSPAAASRCFPPHHLLFCLLFPQLCTRLERELKNLSSVTAVRRAAATPPPATFSSAVRRSSR